MLIKPREDNLSSSPSSPLLLLPAGRPQNTGGSSSGLQGAGRGGTKGAGGVALREVREGESAKGQEGWRLLVGERRGWRKGVEGGG